MVYHNMIITRLDLSQVEETRVVLNSLSQELGALGLALRPDHRTLLILLCFLHLRNDRQRGSMHQRAF